MPTGSITTASCELDEDGAPEIEVTAEMVRAGKDAAQLLTYEWGYPSEEILVARVYRAMHQARLGDPSRPERT